MKDELLPGLQEEETETEGEEEIVHTRSQIHVFNRDQVVCVTFDPAPEYLELPPGDAMRLGKELVARAKRAMRNTSGRVPRA